FKTEHANSGLMGAYYLAPHIPAPDRSIKLGVVWRFYD
ncbi:MAG: putative porin, partial [Bacteroidia bacterium]